jgi:hypothetical protein
LAVHHDLAGILADGNGIWPSVGNANENDGFRRAWLTFQHTLYAWFAIVGGPIEILTIASTAALAFRVRRSPSAFRPTLIAAIILACAFFGIWLGLINPVNSRTATWTADTIPSDWQRWRTQWEYSHAVRFFLQFIALALLLKPVLTKRTSEKTELRDD